MGFFKRIFKLGKRKDEKNHAPELRSAPYLAYSLPHRSQANLHEPPNHETSRTMPSRHMLTSQGAPRASLALPSHRHHDDGYDSGGSVSSRSALSVVPESRDTYRVKVYERVRHSSTTFPSANPPLANRALEPQTPRSRSRSRDPLSPDRLERLRQDPSVTSLLNILDQQGRTKVDAFSDTPKRKQSLRTLLGATSDPEDESDLSWAERLLEDGSSDGHTLEAQEALQTDDIQERTLDSQELEANDPALSSMQVERGTLASDSSISSSCTAGPPVHDTTLGLVRSPSRRASQVFQFLVESRERTSSPDPARSLHLLPSSTTLVASSSEANSPSAAMKPLPIPPSTPLDVDGAKQRSRASSLPLLSYDHLDQSLFPLSTNKTASKSFVGRSSLNMESSLRVFTPLPSRISRASTGPQTPARGMPMEGLHPSNSRKLQHGPNLVARDFLSDIRRRAVSTMGSLVTRKTNKRYSERFVAIEWENESQGF